MEDLDGVRKIDLKHLIQSLRKQIELLDNEAAHMRDYIIVNDMYEDYGRFVEARKKSGVFPVLRDKK